MRYLIVGDLHLRMRPPRCRTEANFKAVCLGKLKQILGIAHRESAPILQVGDFFHSPDPSGELHAETIDIIKEWNVPIFTVHGQHDLSYHSEASRRKSALRVMEAAEALTVLDAESWKSDWLHGAGFGQTPPVPESGNPILVAHAMVGDKPLWPGQELPSPKRYVQKHPGYHLYCLGDYHYPFTVQVGDALVVNPGAVLRLTASKRDLEHRPKVVLYDDEEDGPMNIYLDVTPIETAFDLSAIEEKRDNAPVAAELIRKLGEAGRIGVDFEANLAAHMDQNGTEKEIRDTVWNAYSQTL